MAQTAQQHWGYESEPGKTEEKIARFLSDLTELSRKHGVGITGESVLFLMQTGPESDYESSYKADSESHLLFE